MSFHCTPDPTPGGARAGIDLDVLEGAGLEQEELAEVPQRTRVVPGRLRRDAQPLAAGVADRGGHVLGVDRHRDGGRLLVDGEVEGLPGEVEALLIGGHDGAADIRGGAAEGHWVPPGVRLRRRAS